MAVATSTRNCAFCAEPATTTASYGADGMKLPVCELHAAARTRKNAYMPCVISADFDAMTPKEQAQILRETRWADNITGAEWPVVLRHDGVKAYVRSKLKRKAVGWLMALSRIIWLNRAFGAQVLREADDLYRKQIREDPPIPWRLLADLVEQGWTKDGLAAWLRPLGNLRSYQPDTLQMIVRTYIESRDGWEPIANPSQQDQEAA